MSVVEKFGPRDVAVEDPFTSEIGAALLNSADIDAYATKLEPPLFEPYISKGLKPATYEVTFEGDIYWWKDEKRFIDRFDPNYEDDAFETKLSHQALSGDEHYEIPPNSIVFVSPRTYFRVPTFLALRFNLHIKLVHRGLLLGTGPLVDPGFAGRLLIPVHNLTSQPVVIKADEGFIWVEVTKLSLVRPGMEVKKFEASKKSARTAKDYFIAANSLNPIVSTLHVTSEKLKAFVRWSKTITAIGGVVFMISLVSVLWGGWSLIRDTHNYVTDAKNDGREKVEALELENSEIKAEVNSLKAEVEALSAAVKEGVRSSSANVREQKK